MSHTFKTKTSRSRALLNFLDYEIYHPNHGKYEKYVYIRCLAIIYSNIYPFLVESIAIAIVNERYIESANILGISASAQEH